MVHTIGWARGERNGSSFAEILDTALELKAPVIRVWGGTMGSAKASAEYRQSVVTDLSRIVECARQSGVTIATEFHADTLCDLPESTWGLLSTVPSESLQTLWQSQHGLSVAANAASLRRLLKRLSHLHVFHWWPGPATRLPLSQGARNWKEYLEVARQSSAATWALLEFLEGDDPSLLPREVETLCQFLAVAL